MTRKQVGALLGSLLVLALGCGLAASIAPRAATAVIYPGAQPASGDRYVYHTTDSVPVVAAWYEQHVPGLSHDILANDRSSGRLPGNMLYVGRLRPLVVSLPFMGFNALYWDHAMNYLIRNCQADTPEYPPCTTEIQIFCFPDCAQPVPGFYFYP